MSFPWLKLLGITALSITVSTACESKKADAPSTMLEPTPAPTASPFQEAIVITPRFDAQEQAVAVDLSVQPGYHVYTTGETTGRPIRLEVATGGDWKPAGDPIYPKGTEKTTALGTSVVLEGEVSSTLAVTPAVEKPGKLDGHFYYQVCTDRSCDRPRTLNFSVDTKTGEQ